MLRKTVVFSNGAGNGISARITRPESVVLPLHYRAMRESWLYQSARDYARFLRALGSCALTVKTLRLSMRGCDAVGGQARDAGPLPTHAAQGPATAPSKALSASRVQACGAGEAGEGRIRMVLDLLAPRAGLEPAT